jgi:hypothetical protein
MEDFFKDYQYTFSAMAAIGTMLAVTLSLWLSSNQHRSKIVADVDKRVIDRKNGVMISVARYTDITKDDVEYVTVHISNVGLMSVSIPYQLCYIKKPFSKKFLVVDTMDSKHNNQSLVPQKNYPVKIEPNHSKIFFLSDLESLKKGLDQFGFFSRFFIGFYVSTGDGREFKAKMSAALRRDIRIRIKKAKKTVTNKESKASSPGSPPARG